MSVQMEKSCGCECSCNGELTPAEQELLDQLGGVLEKFVSKPGGLIPALQATQKIFGYLPEPSLKLISEMFDIPYSELTGVVSFYSFFSTEPQGKHLIRVCLGTACYVRGGKEVLEALKKELGIEVGSTTADRLFSLDVGRCFGACGLAPVVMVGDDVFQRVKPSKVNDILARYRALEPASEGGTE